eukprot:CAMPEP_0198210526 /NCGR_PEP_ID=MMETSP1445-20131203/20391_1 /TAXON_ID=36898 /ORGANISM="Pyramimonas sp., Strain CCMP2087" /LENGTH=122 /DNA_ID=CAMNT_0043884607 /DNA_START=188 /DNA_END=553 /DNA_ORIENTATION=-
MAAIRFQQNLHSERSQIYSERAAYRLTLSLEEHLVSTSMISQGASMGMAYERPARRTSHTEALGEFIQDACKGNLASAPCSSFQRPFTPTSSLSSSSSLTSLSSFVSRRSSAVAAKDFETAW